MVTREKFVGCIMGVAIGDALGMPVEMMDGCEIRSRFGRITDFISPKENPSLFFSSRRLRKGSWTDDTQRTLANMNAFIKANGTFDMDAFTESFKQIYASRKNRGWGRSSRRSGARLIKGCHWSESGESGGAGNGVMMGISPLGLLQSLARQPRDEFLNNCITYARMTHLGTPAIVAGAVHALSIGYLAIHGDNIAFDRELYIEHLLDIAVCLEDDFGLDKWDHKISDQLKAIKKFMRRDDFREKSPVEICVQFGGGTAYSANSFGVSYALFIRKPDSFDCVLDAVNAGGDTDSNASIAGALFGVLNGLGKIPANLVLKVEEGEYLRTLANEFFEVAMRVNKQN